MVVQHNLQAMNANRMLGITTKTIGKSTEKLSSGYRINRAADDAAGLSISEKMRKQIRGLTQAASNAEDGISCVQTAEGALNEVQDMLQRMNELCVKAANGTNSKADRQYIQDEIDQLVTEIDRIAETTKFNETFLLKGDEEGPSKTNYVTNFSATYTKNTMVWTDKTQCPVTYCMNYTGNNNLYIVSADIKEKNSNIAMGAGKITKGDDMTKYLVNSSSTWNKGKASLNTDYIAFINVELDSDIKGKDLCVDGNTSIIRAKRDLYIYNSDNDTVTHIKENEVMAKYLEDDNTIDSKYRLVDILDEKGKSSSRVKLDLLGGSDFKWTDKSLEIDESMQKLYDANGQEVSGMALYKYFDDNGNYTGGLYSSEQARAVDEVFANNTSSSYTNIEIYWTAQGKPSPATIGKYIAQSSQEVAAALSFSLHVGAQSERTNKITASIDTLTSAGIGISQIASWNIGIVDETGNNATDAIDVVEKAIQRISQQRSLLGAVQNRLEHTIANLDNVVENTTSAESAIRDTDMAEEMVKNANANILMQAGQSMLAQANQSKQGVLSLLQG